MRAAADWEDLKEEICTGLLLGKKNGEPELETTARIVWAERHKYLTVTISERIHTSSSGWRTSTVPVGR